MRFSKSNDKFQSDTSRISVLFLYSLLDLNLMVALFLNPFWTWGGSQFSRGVGMVWVWCGRNFFLAVFD